MFNSLSDGSASAGQGGATIASRLEKLFEENFATRTNAFDAIRLYELEVNPAVSLRSVSIGGGKKGVYECTSPTCSLRYIVVRVSEMGNVWWKIKQRYGTHNSCLPIKKRQVRLQAVMEQPWVRMQLSARKDRIQQNAASNVAVSRAAKGLGIDLSSSDLSRIRSLETQRLTKLALDGYDSVAYYLYHMVALNPGSKAILQLTCQTSGAVVEIIYSSIYPSKMSSVLPSPTSYYQLKSVFVIPSSTPEIISLSNEMICTDFARVFANEDELKLSVFLLTTTVANKDLTLAFAVFAGPESGPAWEHAREVSHFYLLPPTRLLPVTTTHAKVLVGAIRHLFLTPLGKCCLYY